MAVCSGLYMYDVFVKKFTFAISSPGEFLYKWSPKNGGLGAISSRKFSEFFY